MTQENLDPPNSEEQRNTLLQLIKWYNFRLAVNQKQRIEKRLVENQATRIFHV